MSEEDHRQDSGFDSRRESVSVEECEELAWIESQFKGLIIGKKQKGLNDLKMKTGATVFKKGDSIFVHGTTSQRKDVKYNIQRKIAMASAAGNEDVVDYIPENLIGVIIGKHGSMLQTIFNETGAVVIVKSDKILMKGSSAQKELGHAAIKNILKSAECSEGEEELVDYIPDHLIGLIIGKKGSTAQKIFKDTGASVVATKEGKIILKGSPEERELAHAAIKDILNNSAERKVFATEKDAKYLLLKAGQNSRGNIYWLNPEDPKDKFSFDYKTMPEFQKYVLEQIQELNENAKTGNASGHLYLHVGKLIVCTKKEENEADLFTVGDIMDNIKRSPQPWICNFESAVTDLSPHKLADLPSYQCYVRYDMKISTPTTGGFRYKVYMEENKRNNGMKLCKPEDLAISLQQCARRVGPGLLWSNAYRSIRADLLLPKEFVARFNIDTVYPEDDMQDGDKETEKNIVIESFCKRLTITSIVENDLPKLPRGYDVVYFRRCHRTEYDFHPNILVVSRETEIVNNCSDRIKEQNELVDIRLLSKEFNRLLETTTWTVEEVMEILPNYFGFIGRIFDYLGK